MSDPGFADAACVIDTLNARSVGEAVVAVIGQLPGPPASVVITPVSGVASRWQVWARCADDGTAGLASETEPRGSR